VARGAAYYALSRRGEGLRISGGAARAYYLEVESHDQKAPQQVCLLPRGMEEGSEVALASQKMALLAQSSGAVSAVFQRAARGRPAR
jgi:hypothetical protein